MKLKDIKKALQLKKMSVMASLPFAIAFCTSVHAYANEAASQTTGDKVSARVNKASLSVWEKGKIIGKAFAVCALVVCGLILVIGTNQMKEKVKENFYYIALGIGIIYLASDIAGDVGGMFE